MTATYGRILSVDDEPKIREKIVNYLEDSGFVVFEANNGQEALEIMRNKKPDLVLSDLQMPKMGGLELFENIKKEYPDIPFIVISGTDLISDVIEALRQGAIDYIAKPISNLALLEQAVCRGLEHGRLVLENQRYKFELENKNIQLTRSLLQLKEDQDAGKSVQEKLLPPRNSKIGNFQIDYKIIPSLYLSGDFIDYHQISPSQFFFYIADVSGHGASSAFVTVLLKSIIEKMIENYRHGRDQVLLSPEKVLKSISDDILDAKLGKYLTMIFGIIDTARNEMSYSIGGHYPSPVFVTEDSKTFLEGNGFALGIFKNAVFENHTIALPERFEMILLSDGIFEVMSHVDLTHKENKILSTFDLSERPITEILNKLGLTEKGSPDDVAILRISKGVL